MVFLSLTRPSKAQVEDATREGDRRGFNYPHVGATRGAPPLPAAVLEERWTIDHTRVKLGSGKDTYERSRKALQRWGHFQLGWTTVDASTPVEKGSKVCVLAQILPVWTRNPLEITYVEEKKCKLPPPPVGTRVPAPEATNADATDPARVFTFAHGCLGGHLLAGEERFALEWRKKDDSVWYEIYTFSKPAHPLSILSYPVVRFLQKKFASDSVAAMLVEAERIA